MPQTTYALTGTERLLLVIPLAGGLMFGILPLFPPLFAGLFGFSGNDPYIYQLAGAATLGYAYPLFQAVSGKANWNQIKFIIKATFAFNLISLYACYRALTTPNEGLPVVYLITATSLAIVAITGWLFKKYGMPLQAKKDLAGWVKVILSLATLSAAVFGLFPLVVHVFASFFGYMGTDPFIYRQAGAATFGYAVLGIYQLKSGNFDEIKLPLLMGATFNGIGFVVSILALLKGEQNLLVYTVTAATAVFTTGLIAAYNRHGK